MSNLEHLIEGAIIAIEEHIGFDNWTHKASTLANHSQVRAPLEEIWEIADYIYYTYRPYIEYKKEEELIEEYGYRVE